MAVALATKEGRNDNGQFANCWKRRIRIVAKRAMIYQITKRSMRFLNICEMRCHVMMNYLTTIETYR